MSNTIYIPVESFQRELVPKIILGSFLASKNLNVVVGHKWFVNGAAFSNAKAGDFYLHNHTKSINDVEGLGKLKSLGVILLGYEDEGVFDEIDYNKQIAIRHQENGFEIFDIWMCWGDFDFNVVSTLATKPTKVLNIGNPRSSLWGDNGKSFYEKETSRLKGKYGEYLLFSNSFTYLANNKFMNTMRNLNSVYVETDDTAIRKSASEEKRDLEDDILSNMKVLIKRLLSETQYNLVLRPYNAEYDSAERSIQRLNPKRIFIDTSLNVSSLILGSHATFHMGSTVGIESLFGRTPTFWLNSFSPGSKLPSKVSETLSHSNPSVKEIVSIVQPVKKSSQDIYYFVKKLPYHEFCNLLFENMVLISPNSFLRRGSYPLSTLGKLKSLAKLRLRIKYGNVHRYDLLKRPLIKEKDFRQICNDALLSFGLNRVMYRIELFGRSATFISKRDETREPSAS